MNLSVIIPALDERRTIGAAVDSAVRGDPAEVIVVDGGSSDGTPAIAEARGAAVLASPPGRGVQLHRGAAAASSDQLLFLHADCRLPPDYMACIESILADPRVAAGAFRLHIDLPGRPARVIERMVGLRCRLWRTPYGDQALFTRRETYRRAGGFPPLPVMEDFVLIRRLRRLGRIRIAPRAVTASGRGWASRGLWRTTLLNRACVLAYLFGVSPDRIALWRRPRQPGRARRASARA